MGQGRNQGGTGGQRKISPPYKKLVTIVHDTGIGNLAPLKYFSPP